MVINLMWLVVIVAAAVSQWAIIEKKVREPNKKLWFGIRVAVAAGFTWWYKEAGQYIVWAIPFMITTFAFIFPILLNWFRGKKFGYMGLKGYDGFIMKLMGANVYMYLNFTFFLMGAGMHIVYNHFDIQSWADLM